MQKSDKEEILEVIGDFRELMVEKFERMQKRQDKMEKTLNLHTNILDSHTKHFIDLKHEITFGLHRDERMERDILLLKKKVKIA